MTILDKDSKPIRSVREKYFYFAGAIRGDTSFVLYFRRIIDTINEYGEALTERSDLYNPLDKDFDQKHKRNVEKKIFRRDIMHWLRKSSAVIAEISGPSIGVGYEIRYAIRDKRIPVLCLCHVSRKPSLIVKQDRSVYVFFQEYSDENDLEKYVRCFLEILIRTEYIEDIKEAYGKIAPKIAESNPTAHDIKDLVERQLTFGEPSHIQSDLRTLHAAKVKSARIDFKDSASFVQFMFRNIILQKRWEQLKSQEIGATFVGGRKGRIITVVSKAFRREKVVNFLDIYCQAGQDKIQYTREAFMKNVRAYRRIGLLEAPTAAENWKPKPSAAKFKEKLVLVKTLQGNILVESSRSRREIMNGLVIVTRHLQHLSAFLHDFGSKTLANFLQQSRAQPWYPKIPDVLSLNIDKVSLGQELDVELTKEISTYIHSRCMELWKEKYSSFV